MPDGQKTPHGFEPLSRSTINRLANAGIRSMRQLRSAGDEELRRIRQFGPRHFAEVNALVPDRDRAAAHTRRSGTPPARMSTFDAQARPAYLPITRTRARTSPRQPGRERASAIRLAVRECLQSPVATRGWQLQLSARFGVSRQRVHQVVAQERANVAASHDRSAANR